MELSGLFVVAMFAIGMAVAFFATDPQSPTSRALGALAAAYEWIAMGTTTMQQTRLQLSVVACDLRGFTAFAETAAPEEVILLLREYHERIGEVVTQHGAMIKDFAAT
jgi:class 3 adenylate cyclase